MACNAGRYRQTDRQTDRRTDRQTRIHPHLYTPGTCMSCTVHAWLLQTAKVDSPVSPSDSALLSEGGTNLHIYHQCPPSMPLPFPPFPLLSFPHTFFTCLSISPSLPLPFLLLHLSLSPPPPPPPTHTHIHTPPHDSCRCTSLISGLDAE